MKALFIPGKRKPDMPWGAEFFLEAMMKHSKNEIIPHYGFNDLGFGSSESLYEEADIIHIHNLAHTTLDKRAFFGYNSRIKEYVSYGGQRPVIIGGIRGYQGLKKSRKWLKHFDAIHVNNHQLRREVLKHGAKNAYVLYPGVDMELFKPMPELRPEKFTVGWSGDTDKPTKNSQFIHHLGYNYKIASKEKFIPHDKMPQFYNSLDVYVHFSSHEGWGRGIIEAMACGLPVVSSSTGAGILLSSGWMVPGDPREKEWLSRFKSKIEILRVDPGVREKVGHRNRIHVAPWAWAVIAKKFDKTCKKLTKEAEIMRIGRQTKGKSQWVDG